MPNNRWRLLTLVSRESITVTKVRLGVGSGFTIPAQPQPWRTIVGVVPDTLMQGPFDQQTDTAGFYMPLLGAEPATQFCTIIVRPRPGQRADTLGSALEQGSCRTRFKFADLFRRNASAVPQ